MSRFFQNFGLLTLSLGLTFLILEGSARLYLHVLADDAAFMRYASYDQLRESGRFSGPRFTAHPYLRHYPTPNYRNGPNQHNSLGFRGEEIEIPKPAGEFRIVCLGGSTTYTTAVNNYRRSYPYLLQVELQRRGFENTTVVNGGTGQWSSLHSLISLESRVLDLEPDLIIIYHGINDINSRFVWPPEAYLGDRSGEYAPASQNIPGLLEYSTLCRMLMVRAGLVRSHTDLDRAFFPPSSQKHAVDFRRQKLNQTYPSGVFKQTPAQEMLDVNTPRYFNRNIEHMILIAKYRGIQTMLATFAYSPRFKERPQVSSDEYKAAYQEHNGILKQIAEETGVLLFDFASVFPDDKKYYTDGRHVTSQGAALKARLFADFIEQADIISRQNEE